MSNIVISGNQILFRKALWNDDEILMAKSYWWSIDTDTLVITADVRTTFRKALYEFISYCYPALWNQPSLQDEKTALLKDIDDNYKRLYKELRAIHKAKLPWYDKLRKHQKDALLEMHYRKATMLSFSPRLGKAQPLHSKVLTTSGWKLMGEISTGDRVFDHKGNEVEVTGVFPQGEKDVYRVTMSDGFSAESCDEHLWLVQDKRLSYKDRWEAIPLSKIRERIKYITPNKVRNTWRVPVCPPIELPKTVQIIDPYLLGLLIGDGCISGCSITFSTNDPELPAAIASRLPESLHIYKCVSNNYSWAITVKDVQGKPNGKNPLINQLRDIGLWGKLSGDKFIPDNYVNCSIEQRIEMLRGLMDTDGTIDPQGRMSFSSTSFRVINSLCEIIQSLGGLANIGEDNRENKHSYYVSFILPGHICPFRLGRRVARWKSDKRLKHRRIESVELAGRAECQCISVSGNNHTYITDNYIVTHNTLTACSLSAIHDIQRTIIICFDIGKRNFMYDLTDPKWGGESIWSKLNFTILDRQPKKAIEAFDERFVIVNYESLSKFMRTIQNGPPVGLVIISECQRAKNYQTQISKSIMKLLSIYPDARIIEESGTPVTNRSNDMFGHFRICSHPLGENYADFKRQFSEVDARHGTVVGSVGIPDLRRLSANFVIRRTQEECTDMPRHNYINMYFELGEWQKGYQKAIYDSMHQTGKIMIESAIHSINRIMSLAKVDGVIEAVELMVDAGEKVVVFSNYTDPLLKMQKHFGKSCTLINGQTKDKFKEAQRFKDDPECMVLLGNTDSAGHTVDLSISSNLYVLDFPLSPKKLEQAADRVKNLSKTSPCNVHFCIAKGNGKVPTVDERLRELIGGKDSDINALMDGSEAKGFQDDVAQILWRELLEQYSNQGNEEELEPSVEERSNS